MSIDNVKSTCRRLVSSPGPDYTLHLPDDCLTVILHSLPNYNDRNSFSLVCLRWLQIESHSRRHLKLYPRYKLLPSIPSIFARFHFITELTLTGFRNLSPRVNINDQTLILISLNCKNLTRLTLLFCREITSHGVESMSKNCLNLKIFSCLLCTFDARGFNAILDNCTFLEELYIKKPGKIIEPIAPKKACSSSLKLIFLQYSLDNGEVFGPLINAAASKSLTTLKLSGFTLSDELLLSISGRANLIREVYLNSVDYCGCDDGGIVTIAKRCKSLRKLHIDSFWNLSGGRRAMGDQGLMAVAENCRNLQELVLDFVSPTKLSIGMLGVNCAKLERLTLVKSGTVRDEEIRCIARKCNALKWLRIEHCPEVSDDGVQALASGCPSLVEVHFKNCKKLTLAGVDRLRAKRPSLVVALVLNPTTH